MLKAIWPSLAHLNNGLAPGANITTAGMPVRSCQESHSCTDEDYRYHVLFPVLAHPVPLDVRLPTEDSMAIHDQGVRRPARMAGDAHLGIRQGAVEQGPV